MQDISPYVALDIEAGGMFQFPYYPLGSWRLSAYRPRFPADALAIFPTASSTGVGVSLSYEDSVHKLTYSVDVAQNSPAYHTLAIKRPTGAQWFVRGSSAANGTLEFRDYTRPHATARVTAPLQVDRLGDTVTEVTSQVTPAVALGVKVDYSPLAAGLRGCEVKVRAACPVTGATIGCIVDATKRVRCSFVKSFCGGIAKGGLLWENVPTLSGLTVGGCVRVCGGTVGAKATVRNQTLCAFATRSFGDWSVTACTAMRADGKEAPRYGVSFALN